jgi:uncharacterized protein YqeY
MLLDQLQAAYKQAMIDKNPLAKEALSSTIAMIKNKKIDLQRDLTEDEMIKCIQKEVKTRSEGASFYQQAGKNEEYNDEMEKVHILEGFLPSLLSEEELQAIVKAYITKLAIEDPLKQRGILINAIKAEYGASVDGGLLNKVISE